MGIKVKSIAAKGVAISPKTKELISQKLDAVGKRLPDLEQASLVFKLRPHTHDVEVKLTIEGGSNHLHVHGEGKTPSDAFKEAVTHARRIARQQSEKRTSKLKHYTPPTAFAFEEHNEKPHL
jgi:ribosome-associated translation inhibitor RaiA